MNTCKITIPYTPKAKGSVRIGKFGHYNPSCKGMFQTREFVKNFLANKTFPLMNGPLLVIVHYRIPAPRTLSYKKRSLQDQLPHSKKPDGDNLEKFLNDALNGIVWNDDSNIVWMIRSKSITSSKNGSTTIFVKQLPMNKPDYNEIISDIRDNINLEIT